VKRDSKSPRILIMGRPNVGKSTLFNRLLGRRRALVHDLPGVTRDRMEEKATWYRKGREVTVRLIDTGGLGEGRFAAEIAAQVRAGLEDADLVLMIFDGQTGITPEDREVLQMLQRSGLRARLPVIGVVNKIDAEQHEAALAEFYESGLDPILTVSAEHNRGIDDLQQEVLSRVETEADETDPAAEAGGPETHDSIPRIAIVGRPNVGKSTLVNALLDEKRMITSPIAGTTVDAVDSRAIIDDREVILIDTAGIRRKSKTEEGVEVLSVIQARKALERANIALLVLDGETGITDQDEKIGGLIEEAGTSVVLLINKWDTQKKNPEFTREHAAEWVRKEIGFLKYAPIVFTSGLKRQGLKGLGELFEDILGQRSAKITTKELTEWVRREAGVHNPLNAKFYLSHQVSRHPPTFICHVSDPDKVHFSLRRHLSNGIREKWGYMGTPIRLLFQAGKSNRRAKSASELQRKEAETREDPKKKAARRAAQRGIKKAAIAARFARQGKA
jgi:GTP-binding protein